MEPRNTPLINTESLPQSGEPDIASMEREVIDLIERSRIMTLATCANGRVMARSMSTIHDGMDIYLQCANDSNKAEQIRANPLVALCSGSMQLEGVASFNGHPLAEANTFFATTYSRIHPGSFATYSHLKRNEVVKIKIVMVTLWKYTENNRPFRDFWDVNGQRVWREMYALD